MAKAQVEAVAMGWGHGCNLSLAGRTRSRLEVEVGRSLSRQFEVPNSPGILANGSALALLSRDDEVRGLGARDGVLDAGEGVGGGGASG
jgi:hypothetical protein